MPGDIPDLRFRLPETFAVQPELVIDEGPARGLLIGQNAPREEFDAVFLGKHAEAPHKTVWLDARGAHAVYVMGKRRSGKSYTLGAIAEALVSDTWLRQGGASQAVLILDSMNVFLTMPFTVEATYSASSAGMKELHKWGIQSDDVPVRLFTPHGSTVPRDVQAQGITLRASDLGIEEWCGLFEVDPFVDPLGHLMATLFAKVADEGYIDSIGGGHVAPKSEFSIEDMLKALSVDPDLAGFVQDTRDALRRRLETLVRFPLFGAAGLDVRDLLRPGTISVLLLRDLDQEMRSVMVSIVVKRMMRLRAVSEQQERMVPVHLARAEKYASSDPGQASVEREHAEECLRKAAAGLPRSWLIIDEAHNYIPSRSTVPSRRPLKKYVDEGRNLGLSIVVATQQPSGLDPSIQRNADVLLVHALSHHDDIAAAQGMINSAEPEEVVLDGKYRITGPRLFERLVRALPLGYALASTDRANRLFPVRIRPRSTVHGGADY